MLKMIAKLLKVLNSENEPGQISLAFCFALIMGFTPLYSLHNILVVLAVLLVRVNLSAFILGSVVFSGIAYLLDPLFHHLGLFILQLKALEGLWTLFYNLTILRLANFNNSIVMGSLVFGLILFVPFYYFSNLLILKYREHVLAWIQKTKLMQAFKANRFYRIYQSVTGWGGNS